MERFLNLECNPQLYSPLTLAFMGDCVYEMLVREELLCSGNIPAKKLHTMSVEKVRREAQASAIDKIMDSLTEDEEAIYRRGRNAHTTRTGNKAEYHKATGLETLFGCLYLNGNIDRIRELYKIIIE